MKRILINATQNEEIRVALCKGNHLYDFDLENRTREQKKSNIYKGHVTRVEPSLEAVFVEYGSQRQGFLPIREISSEYLSGNPRDENIKKLIKEGDELIVQVEKEERGNKGAALSTYVSLAGRYLVLMPNNPRGGGISRQISGKLREDMKRMLSNLELPKGMSVIIRTAGIGKTQEDLQHDLNHLLNIWQAIQEQNQKYPSPRLVHQEAGVVTRAVRDYLRDDIAEIWIDNENAYIEAAGFIDAVMPTQAEKLRKYTDYEPMFSRFNIEKQIETAYQREVRLPSGGSIVIDQTEALVSIDINSAKSTKGSDVAETAYHTNLEAADEIARQLRLRDMGGLIVIDFIDMNDNKHQKEVEKRLVDATKYDRARVQFGEISKFGLMEMSRQRLRPSLEESTGYICPRCHGNGMIRDLRSLSLSIMRQIEQIALKERQGEVQAEVPTDIAAFLLNEKRDSLVYLEQDSGTRITILPHAHLESPNFKLHFNRDGFAPSSYERITDTAQEHSDLGYDVDWQTAEKERPEQQPTRQPRPTIASSQAENRTSSLVEQQDGKPNTHPSVNNSVSEQTSTVSHSNEHRSHNKNNSAAQNRQPVTAQVASAVQPQAVAWLSNLFAQAPQAQTTHSVSSHDAAEAIEALVNTGAQSLGSFGQVDSSALADAQSASKLQSGDVQDNAQVSTSQTSRQQTRRDNDDGDERKKRQPRKSKSTRGRQRKDQRDESEPLESNSTDNASNKESKSSYQDKRNDTVNGDVRGDNTHGDEQNQEQNSTRSHDKQNDSNRQDRSKRKPHSQRSSRGTLERNETVTAANTSNAKQDNPLAANDAQASTHANHNQVVLQVNVAPTKLKSPEVVHLSLDDSKPVQQAHKHTEQQADTTSADDSVKRDSKDVSSKDEANASFAAVDNALASSEKVNEPSAIVKEPALAKPTTDRQALADKVEQSDGAIDNNAISTADKADVAIEVDEATANASSLDNDLITPTYNDLFAKRYVTANKFGQASNDPRVVRAQQAKPSTLAVEQTVASVPTINGSVGGFIRTMLAEADTRLANEGVIGCFIAAIAEYKQQAATGHDTVNSKADKSDSFDFSNFGYQPLSANYLDRFYSMTQAVGEFAAIAGKTAVTPSTITQRASNDPRGQHPDLKQPAVSSAASEPQAEVSQETSMANSLQDEANDRYQDHADITSVAEASVDAVDVDAHQATATALTGAAQTENISLESEQLLQVDAELKANDDSSSSSQNSTEGLYTNDANTMADDYFVEQALKEDSQANKSKTTIASYKNMIENVAEQLLPQTGMFNLTTPKVPKARTRKPKIEHKKPTQAEKLEADDVDDES